VVQWAKPKCQVSLADPQLEGKEEEEEEPVPQFRCREAYSNIVPQMSFFCFSSIKEINKYEIQ